MCSALILTNNLAAPFFGQILRQLVYSLCQRINDTQIMGSLAKKGDNTNQRQLQDQTQDLKVRIIKAAVEKELSGAEGKVEQQNNLTGESEEKHGQREAISGSETGVQVSVDLKILLKILRTEVAQIGNMVREEGQHPDRVKDLQSQKDELAVLLERVENELQKRKENQIGSHHGDE